MMIIEDQEHLDKVREFARSVGAPAERRYGMRYGLREYQKA
jgi:hypothetical protein